MSHWVNNGNENVEKIEWHTAEWKLSRPGKWMWAKNTRLLKRFELECLLGLWNGSRKEELTAVRTEWWGLFWACGVSDISVWQGVDNMERRAGLEILNLGTLAKVVDKAMEGLAWWGNYTAEESKNKKANVSLYLFSFLYSPKKLHLGRDGLFNRAICLYECVDKDQRFWQYVLVLRVLIANADSGSKLRVEDSCYFKTNLLEIIIICVTVWI